MVTQIASSKSEFEITELNGIPLVQLPACLNINQADELKNICIDIIQAQPLQIVFDFSKVKFTDSSFIGAISNIVKTTNQQKIQLIVWSVSSDIKAVLASSGIASFLVFDSQTNTLPLSQKFFLKSQAFNLHPSVKSLNKRLIDIIGSLIGLGIIAILFIPIAIAIQLDNPGPILFSQTRCGWLGKPFRLWKFRSMVTNAEDLKWQVENQVKGPFFKNKEDPRITRVGRFLRYTSLDELPQFWNVLKGEMSLVGTRPPTCDEVDQYTSLMWQRLNIKPGMTGEWQTNGRSEIANFEDVLKLDLYYQSNWNILYDLKLIFKTVVIILKKTNGAA